MSDEKNLFKVGFAISAQVVDAGITQVEQDYDLASGEYEHYNNLLKTELPAFLALATRFIDPLFHSFYYMQ